MIARMLVLLLLACSVAFTAVQVRASKSARPGDLVPEKYRNTVKKGLDYLLKHQHRDGHWEGDEGKHPVAMTGLVGIALLMEKINIGHRGNEALRMELDRREKLPANLDSIRKAADWLIEQARPERGGLIFSGHASEMARYMEGHALATLFLAGALEHVTDKERQQKLSDVLTNAVKYIVRAQTSRGGWHHTSRTEGHDLDAILPTVLQIHALHAAANVGIPVSDDVLDHAQSYLQKMLARFDDSATGTNRLAETTAAIAGQLNFENVHRAIRVAIKRLERAEKGREVDENSKRWIKYCQSKITVGKDVHLERDEMTHYHYSLTLHRSSHADDENWTKYRTAMFDLLQARQNKDGSWPACNGLGVGTVYSTAVWCIVLQHDRNSFPAIPNDTKKVT